MTGYKTIIQEVLNNEILHEVTSFRPSKIVYIKHQAKQQERENVYTTKSENQGKKIDVVI